MSPPNGDGRPTGDALADQHAGRVATDLVSEGTPHPLTVDPSEVLVLEAELAQVVASRREVSAR